MPGFFNAGSWKAKEERQPTIARCGKCGLSKKCFSPKMEVLGKGRREILIVAEAPGKEEDRQGKQCIGKAGNMLRDLLDDIGVDLDDCWKTNAIICHPSDGIDSKQIEYCRPNLLNTIKELKPKVIIPLGISAVNALCAPLFKKGIGKMERWVGWAIPALQYNAWVCPTYHPSYLFHQKDNTVMKLIMGQHLQRAMDLEGDALDFPPLKGLEKEVEIILDELPAKKRLRNLLQKKGKVAFDYECTGLKPEREDQRIVSCSFCFEGEDTFAFPVTEGTHRLLSKVLRNPDLEKIAANLKYEERWTRCKLGHGVENWGWDTMIAAHVQDNRQGITGLKFQAFIQLGVGDYDGDISGFLTAKDSNSLNQIHKIDMPDLLLYNGLDSLLEYRLSEVQRKVLRCK